MKPESVPRILPCRNYNSRDAPVPDSPEAQGTGPICQYGEHDDLKLYQGYSIRINDFLVIRQPTLGEICRYGERNYYNMIHTLCSVGADLKWQLDEAGIDYTKIPDFELFYTLLAGNYTAKDTEILFGCLPDFSGMKIMFHSELKENVMVQYADGKPLIQIDRYVYSAIVDILRRMHRLRRNDELPGNEATRKILIDDAREEYEKFRNQPVKSHLLPLISAMVNSSGFKRDDITVFDMKIFAFMDSVARIGKIRNADLLLSSGYSGFGINLNEVDNEALNWMGELDI